MSRVVLRSYYVCINLFCVLLLKAGLPSRNSENKKQQTYKYKLNIKLLGSGRNVGGYREGVMASLPWESREGFLKEVGIKNLKNLKN